MAALLLLGGVVTCACATGGLEGAAEPDHASTSATGSPSAEGPAPAVRSRAIAAYREHLQRFPDSPEYDEISRRLADLLLQRAAERQLLIASRPAEADRLQRESSRDYREAISLYEALLERSPADRELLYQLSRAYEEVGDSERAVQVIDRLIAQPAAGDDLQLVSDSLFRQGELQFSRGEYAAAESAYRAVVRLGNEVPAYGQSLYKLGWSLYQQERYREALAAFFAFLDTHVDAGSPYGQQVAGLSLADREQLGELLAIISQCFALLGGVDVVTDYFAQREATVYDVPVYRALAEWYESRDRISEAAETWQVLARRAPLADDAPSYAARAIGLYRQSDFQDKKRDSQQAFIRDFGPRSDFWAQRDRMAYPDVIGELELGLPELADYYHGQWRLTRDAGDADSAQRYYRDYLSWFDGSEGADSVRFQLAELLYEGARYREAYAQYARIARAPERSPLAAEAALGALRASDASMDGVDPGDVATLEIRAREDALRFVQTWPAHEAAPRLLARVGGELLQREDYSRLEALVDPILAGEGSGRDELLQVAWTLSAQAASARGDDRAAIDAYRNALMLTADDDQRKPALQSGLAIALLSAARDAAERGEWAAAAAGFEEAAGLPADDSLGAAALDDLASALLAQQRWPDAIEVLARYRDSYPADARQPEVARKLAFACEQDGDIECAAREYLAIGRDTGQQPMLRRQALLRAVDLFQQAGEVSSAVGAGEYFVDAFREPADQSIPLMRELALLERQRGNQARHREWLEAIVALDRSSGNESTRAAAAESALQLAEHRMAAFRQVQLVDPLERNLSRKLEAMERALVDFEAAADYGVASVTSAANYHMASMYEELGQALLASERPRSLSADELAEYEQLLAEQAAPFSRQAIELYSLNAGRAESGRPDPWIDKSLEQLHHLQVELKQPGGA